MQTPGRSTMIWIFLENSSDLFDIFLSLPQHYLQPQPRLIYSTFLSILFSFQKMWIPSLFGFVVGCIFEIVAVSINTKHQVRTIYILIRNSVPVSLFLPLLLLFLQETRRNPPAVFATCMQRAIHVQSGTKWHPQSFSNSRTATRFLWANIAVNISAHSVQPVLQLWDKAKTIAVAPPFLHRV